MCMTKKSRNIFRFPIARNAPALQKNSQQAHNTNHDQIAALLIATKKETGVDIRLVMALPCREQGDLWTAKEKEVYHWLLSVADSVVYVSETYSDGCMKKRNEYMVEQSEYCICALIRERSGTGQTVRYAKQKQLQIINVAK